MVFSPRFNHLFKLSLILLAFLSAGFYLFSDHDYHHVYHVAKSGKKALFVAKAVDVEVDGPFDNSTLVEMCASTQWREGLMFYCQPPEGGIANVRNLLLQCIRYSIDAGATSIVIPEIKVAPKGLRGPNNGPVEPRPKVLVPFGSLFDFDWLVSSLTSACPKISIVASRNDLYQVPSTAKSYSMNVRENLKMTFQKAPYDNFLKDPSTFASNFAQWLTATVKTPFSASKPILVDIGLQLLQWPLSYDEPEFVASFGRILRPALPLRELAAEVLFLLSSQHGLALSPSASGILAGKFYGAHLRTAADAKEAGWTPYSVQASNYLHAAKHNDLSLIYLVCGNASDIDTFTQQAQIYSSRHPMLTVTAASLLSASPSLALLDSLTAHQRSLVDFTVLTRSSVFGGTFESSFSWAVALRRHVVWGNGTWVPQLSVFDFDRGVARGNKTEGYMDGPVGGYGGGGFQSFRDGAGGRGMNETDDPGMRFGEYGLSVVFGPSAIGQKFEKGMWP